MASCDNWLNSRWWKVPILVQLLVRPLSDSLLTEGQFCPHTCILSVGRNVQAAYLLWQLCVGGVPTFWLTSGNWLNKIFSLDRNLPTVHSLVVELGHLLIMHSTIIWNGVECHHMTLIHVYKFWTSNKTFSPFRIFVSCTPNTSCATMGFHGTQFEKQCSMQ
jgi:hypothetical protein